MYDHSAGFLQIVDGGGEGTSARPLADNNGSLFADSLDLGDVCITAYPSDLALIGVQRRDGGIECRTTLRR